MKDTPVRVCPLVDAEVNKKRVGGICLERSLGFIQEIWIP